MNPSQIAAYPTGNSCNADPHVRALGTSIKPLIHARNLAGRTTIDIIELDRS